jgi:hypothetical protein
VCLCEVEVTLVPPLGLGEGAGSVQCLALNQWGCSGSVIEAEARRLLTGP